MYRAILVAAVFGLVLCEEKVTSHTEFSAPRDGNKSLFDYSSASDQRVTIGTVNSTFAVHGKDQRNHSIVREKRTINGTPVNDQDYPYVVALMKYYQPSCGGTIITPMLVLTAAHCLMQPLTHVRTSLPRMMHKIDGGFQHPNYDHGTTIHDIAVIVLVQRIANAQTISLQPTAKKVADNSMASAFGWGMTENSYMSSELRRVEIPLLYPSQCKPFHPGMGNVVCTDARQANVCYGDSGGPLIYDDKQIGVVSKGSSLTPRGMHICHAGLPTVFTRVSAYYQWIQEKMRMYA